jgi:glutamate-1-semialdehyde 2,1-aminomutase
MVAGLTTLKLIQEDGFYDSLEEKAAYLMSGLAESAARHGIPLTTNQAGSMFGFFFSEESRVTNYQQVMACNAPQFNSFFHRMIEAGVYLAPASFEAAFMSAAHTQEDLDFTLQKADDILKTL